jgi:hypothetical protein
MQSSRSDEDEKAQRIVSDEKTSKLPAKSTAKVKPHTDRTETARIELPLAHSSVAEYLFLGLQAILKRRIRWLTLN